MNFNPLTPNGPYRGRTAPLTSNIGTEYFKHGIYSPFFPFQNTVRFIILTYLVPVLFTFYIQGVLKLKKNNSDAKRLKELVHGYECHKIREAQRLLSCMNRISEYCLCEFLALNFENRCDGGLLHPRISENSFSLTFFLVGSVPLHSALLLRQILEFKAIYSN